VLYFYVQCSKLPLDFSTPDALSSFAGTVSEIRCVTLPRVQVKKVKLIYVKWSVMVSYIRSDAVILSSVLYMYFRLSPTPDPIQ